MRLKFTLLFIFSCFVFSSFSQKEQEPFSRNKIKNTILGVTIGKSTYEETLSILKKKGLQVDTVGSFGDMLSVETGKSILRFGGLIWDKATILFYDKKILSIKLKHEEPSGSTTEKNTEAFLDFLSEYTKKYNMLEGTKNEFYTSKDDETLVILKKNYGSFEVVYIDTSLSEKKEQDGRDEI